MSEKGEADEVEPTAVAEGNGSVSPDQPEVVGPEEIPGEPAEVAWDAVVLDTSEGGSGELAREPEVPEPEFEASEAAVSNGALGESTGLSSGEASTGSETASGSELLEPGALAPPEPTTAGAEGGASATPREGGFGEQDTSDEKRVGSSEGQPDGLESSQVGGRPESGEQDLQEPGHFDHADEGLEGVGDVQAETEPGDYESHVPDGFAERGERESAEGVEGREGVSPERVPEASDEAGPELGADMADSRPEVIDHEADRLESAAAEARALSASGEDVAEGSRSADDVERDELATAAEGDFQEPGEPTASAESGGQELSAEFAASGSEAAGADRSGEEAASDEPTASAEGGGQELFAGPAANGLGAAAAQAASSGSGEAPDAGAPLDSGEAADSAEAEAEAVAVAQTRPDLSADEKLDAALEGLLLVVDVPAGEELLANALEQPVERIRTALWRLSSNYAESERGIDLRRVGDGWRFYTRETYAPYVERYLLDGQRAKLTRAALETLAVIAYRQPVTRSRVAAVRGVNVDGVIRTLLARGLIEEAGTDPDTGGTLYCTTELFLERLGLSSLKDLPPLAPLLPEVDAIDDV